MTHDHKEPTTTGISESSEGENNDEVTQVDNRHEFFEHDDLPPQDADDSIAGIDADLPPPPSPPQKS